MHKLLSRVNKLLSYKLLSYNNFFSQDNNLCAYDFKKSPIGTSGALYYSAVHRCKFGLVVLEECKEECKEDCGGQTGRSGVWRRGAALGANEKAQRRRGFEGRPRTGGPARRYLCRENAEIERLFPLHLVDTTLCVSQR